MSVAVTPPPQLTEAGTSTFGRLFHFAGIFEFGAPDLTTLKLGDAVIDNNGKGRRMVVHECGACPTKFLRTLVAFVPVYCSENCRKLMGGVE